MLLKIFLHFASCIYWSRQSVEKTRAMQLKRFKRIFEYARKHSSFYHSIYEKAGVLDLKIESWDDVQKVPIVNKAMMREAGLDAVMTCKYDERLHRSNTTSGSSGIPFKIVYEKWVDFSGHVRLLWCLLKSGYAPWRRITLLSRFTKQSKIGIEENMSVLKLIQKKLGFFQRDFISVFEPINVIVDKIKQQRPYMLWASPSSAVLVSHELERRKEHLDIPILMLLAETCTEENLLLFKDRLCRRVVDVYGCTELPTIGISVDREDCKEVLPNFALVEVVDRREAAGRCVGDLVATNLLNKIMPFIRYDLGDYVGVLQDKDFPTKKIGKVFGRFDDIIKIGSRFIYYHCVYDLFADFMEVDQYKLYQHKDGHLEFQMRLAEGVSEEDAIVKASARWNKAFPDVAIDFSIRDNFELDRRTGKFKVIEVER